ncbi:MAG: hypothetical protein ACKVS9_04655 [Phycisphaerae bacterium]
MLCLFARTRCLPVALTVAASALLSAANPASAQFEDFQAAANWGRIDDQIVVPVSAVQRMTITSLGRTTIDPGSEIGPRGCEESRTYTDADFEGGTFVAQAGFAQGETAAASYTIPATHFPIQIVSVEMVFVQDQATVQTTTQWGVKFWAGNPSINPGPIRSFDSDGLILPHIVMGQGTQGTNVFFAIDPNDPNQIVIENNGSNTFSVGYTINQHNEPPANPCQTAPPPRRNAFPATDASGLASATNNWLGAINCGPISCVPNGGFVRFSQLISVCRPTGDWVLRVVYRPLDCQPGVGACCISGVCSVRTATECAANGGSYLGDGTTCVGVTCPTPNQACCFASTGGCLNLNPATCSGAGGVPGGPGSNCGTFVCFPMGACCLPDGTCVGPVSPDACATQGGTFQGNNTNCGSVTCPLPVGACCFVTGFCIELSETDCGIAGGSWAGVGSDCSDANGNGRADDCEVACPGDVDSDNDVDLTDLATLLTNFGTPSGMTRAQGDLDGDGDVDLSDLAALLANFGRTC